MIVSRRDVAPEYTVERIKSILANLGIAVNLSSMINNKDRIYSCRLEFTDFPGIGTDGKGVSSEYAHASAYAEFIERLQTGLLTEGWFYQKKKAKQKYNNDIGCIIQIYREYLNEYIIDDLSDDNLSTWLENDPAFCKMTPYFEANTGEYIMLPDNFIFQLCVSNGIASGNSLNEACTHGICEIFERYVSRQIYFSNDYYFPEISETLYRDTHSYFLINMLKEKGYTVIVKDCTLGGVYPVLGVILLSVNRKKYKISLGSDINFDICLQRCLTELLQGLNLTTLKAGMVSLDAQSNNFWQLNDHEVEYEKFYLQGVGRVPRKFFLSIPAINNEVVLKPFHEKKVTSEEALVYLCNMIKANNLNLFVSDYSFLGFPTVRIYIPGISEIAERKKGFIMTMRMLLLEIQDAYHSFTLENKGSGRELLRLMKMLLSNQYIPPYTSLENLVGIMTSEEVKNKQTIYHFTAELALYINHTKDAYEIIESYYSLLNNPLISKYANIEKTIFDAIANNVNLHDLKGLLFSTVTNSDISEMLVLAEHYYDIHAGRWSIIECKDCEKCKVNESCSYNIWNRYWSVVTELKANYVDKEYYDNPFYHNLHRYINK